MFREIISTFIFVAILFSGLAAVTTSCTGGGGGSPAPVIHHANGAATDHSITIVSTPDGHYRPAPDVVYLWATDATTTGNLAQYASPTHTGTHANIMGGNIFCQANSATLSGTLTHRAAIISTRGRVQVSVGIGGDSMPVEVIHPKNFFSGDPVVRRPDGTLIADTWEAFWDLHVAINEGVTTLSGADTTYWVGYHDNNETCKNWTHTTYALNVQHPDNTTRGAIGETTPFFDRLHGGTSTCRTLVHPTDPTNHPVGGHSLLCVSY